MIEFENVCFGYGSESTIRDISFSVKSGEFVAVLGSNGAGKSTTIKLMRGLLKPTSGRIIINGKDISTVKASSLASEIGFLFQNPDRQICKNTVREELLFSLIQAGIPSEQHEGLIDKTVKGFDLEPSAESFSLSRGERQKLALASALISMPKLLILDEPTTGLDYKECIQIMEYVKELNQAGTTVVMVSHDMELVLDFADRAILMNNGHLVGDKPPVEVFYNQEVMAEASLLPPQIIGLSLDLQEKFGRVCTVEEMANAVIKAAGKEYKI